MLSHLTLPQKQSTVVTVGVTAHMYDSYVATLSASIERRVEIMPRITPKETPDKRPVASWSSGKEVDGTDRIFKGWFIDVGLDDRLDAACDAAGWERGGLAHLDGEIREHWLLPSPCPIFVLIQGVPFTTMPALVKSDVAYTGLKAYWPKDGRSVLAFQALHPDLLANDYVEPIPFSVRSTSTDDLLAALLTHNAVLDACEAAAAAKGTPRTFEFWEVALPLAAGSKVARGKDLQSPISPIVCVHPPKPDVAYLRTVLAPKMVADIIESAWPQITSWAADRGAVRPEAAEAVVAGK